MYELTWDFFFDPSYSPSPLETIYSMIPGIQAARSASEARQYLTRRASDQARYIVRAGGLREIDAGGPAWLENFG